MVAAILFWVAIGILFISSIIALKYPVFPGFILIIVAYLLYGFIYNFDPLTIWFWGVQLFFIATLFITDYVAGMVSVKYYGGSKYAMYGSVIGLLIGPFLMPFLGIIAGPFLGAVLAELIFSRKPFKMAFKAGVGAIIGLFGSTFLKALIQTVMFAHFLFFVLW